MCRMLFGWMGRGQMTQIEAVFRMNSKFGSSFPGIPFRGSRDPCFPGWAIISPNTGVGNCQILPFRINPIDTNTQSLTCNPSQNEGYKKRIPPSRYRHMTSGFIFKIFFCGCIKRWETFAPSPAVISSISGTTCRLPWGFGTHYHGRWLQCVVWSCKQRLLLQELGGGWKLQDSKIHGIVYAQIKPFNPGYTVDWFLTCNPKIIYIQGRG